MYAPSIILLKGRFPVLYLWMFLSAALYGEDIVILKRGDVLRGNISRQTDNQVVLEHPDLGELVINFDRIESVNPAKIVEEIEQEVVPEKEPSLIQQLKDKGWSMTFDFSLNGSYGNTDEQSSRLGFDAKREFDNEIFKFDFSYYNKIKESKVSDNKFSTGFRNQWFDGPKFYKFLLGRYDYDEFKSWRERASIHAGPGYYLIRNDVVQWSVLAGLGTRKEWGSINDSVKFEGLVGTDFTWGISRRQNFDITYLYYQALNSSEDDYRMWLDFKWRFALDREATIEWLIGGLYEYQSVVNEGDQTYDTRLYTGIQFTF
jgi:putative salt-induced outer membrane protein YdiY